MEGHHTKKRFVLTWFSSEVSSDVTLKVVARTWDEFYCFSLKIEIKGKRKTFLTYAIQLEPQVQITTRQGWTQGCRGDPSQAIDTSKLRTIFFKKRMKEEGKRKKKKEREK